MWSNIILMYMCWHSCTKGKIFHEFWDVSIKFEITEILATRKLPNRNWNTSLLHEILPSTINYPAVVNTRAVTSSVKSNDCGFLLSGSHTSKLAALRHTLSAPPTCKAVRALALMLPSAPPVIYQQLLKHITHLYTTSYHFITILINAHAPDATPFMPLYHLHTLTIHTPHSTSSILVFQCIA